MRSPNSSLRIEDSDRSVDLTVLDLNLLVVLHALLRVRNITHASENLRITHPATSRALGRLRQMFDDDLLIRQSRSFDLTPLAERLAKKVEVFLVNVDKIFSNRIPAPERFTVAMPDHLGLSLVESLTGYFRESSPSTMFLPVFSATNMLSQLEQGRMDLAAGLVDDAPNGFFCRALPPVPSLCLCRKGHIATRRKTRYSDLNRFLSVRIGMGFANNFRDIYDGLEGLRPQGGEVLTVPDIHTAARLVEDADAILVLPAASARLLSARYSLEAFMPEKGAPPPPYRISLIWHNRWNGRSLHAGARSVIAAHILEGSR